VARGHRRKCPDNNACTCPCPGRPEKTGGLFRSSSLAASFPSPTPRSLAVMFASSEVATVPSELSSGSRGRWLLFGKRCRDQRNTCVRRLARGLLHRQVPDESLLLLDSYSCDWGRAAAEAVVVVVVAPVVEAGKAVAEGVVVERIVVGEVVVRGVVVEEVLVVVGSVAAGGERAEVEEVLCNGTVTSFSRSRPTGWPKKLLSLSDSESLLSMRMILVVFFFFLPKKSSIGFSTISTFTGLPSGRFSERIEFTSKFGQELRQLGERSGKKESQKRQELQKQQEGQKEQESQPKQGS
jgi:hypothetical protein